MRCMFVTHLLRPFLIFLLVATVLEFSGIDLWLADLVYHWSGDMWSWRDAWLTATLIHEGGRTLVAVLVVALLVAVALSYRVQSLRQYRSGLWYLLVTALVSGLVVNIGKRVTQVDSPWELLRYGGTADYVRNFTSHAHTGGVGGCFPAGHASAGYGWLGFYYLVRHYWPSWRFHALGAVLLLGLVFGVGQQLRGAHFISHDVWTLGLCWLVATALALWWLPQHNDGLPVQQTTTP